LNTCHASALILLATSIAAAQPASGPPGEKLDWRAQEQVLSKHVQLTLRDKFVKAGEAYFSPDANWVIFQAVPTPAAGQRPDDFYSMYVAKVTREEGGRVSGLGDAILVSAPGSANTCGWFHPAAPYRVIFGSTINPPQTDQKSGFQVGSRKYVWLFPEETDICSRTVLEIYHDMHPVREGGPIPQWGSDAAKAEPIFTRPDYDAECSYSKDGRYILYAHVREAEKTAGRADADIWIYDTEMQKQIPLVTADGYDGGPFFSPDGRRICYRSDRELNDQLQLFVAELKFDASGVPVGIEHEYQVTRNEHVNWAPFWHPSGKFLIYGTSEVGHWNYEVFAIEIDEAKLRGDSPETPAASALRQARVTYANGADVLPVFSPDGKRMMWTAQRGPMVEGEQKPSSQLWVAEFDAAALKFE
jgi:TolB protein